GIRTFLVSRIARQSVKVALSADGGDELFSGYQHYDTVLEHKRVLARLPWLARHGLSRTLRLLPAASLQGWADLVPAPAPWRHAARRVVIDRLEKLRVVLPEVAPEAIYDLATSFWTPTEVARLLGEQLPPRPLLNGHRRSFIDHMSLCDLRHYLPDDILTKVDRTTMAVGLEGREPLLDHRLVEFAWRLPPGLRRGALGTKHLLRRVLYRYVPRAILERPKQGFSMPMSRWLRGELAPLIDTYLDPERIRAAGILDPSVVARALSNFREGGPRRDRLDVQKVWLLAAFEM